MQTMAANENEKMMRHKDQDKHPLLGKVTQVAHRKPYGSTGRSLAPTMMIHCLREV